MDLYEIIDHVTALLEQRGRLAYQALKSITLDDDGIAALKSELIDGQRVAVDEDGKVLSGIYNWFSEGFGTKDLQSAKALIEELSH